MKLKKEFITHISGEESFLVPTGNADFSGMIRGNKTLGVILELLRDDTTEEVILAAMKARFDAPEEKIGKDLSFALSELRKVGALDE